MAYDEYDYSNESNAGSPSLKESLYNILNGLQNEKNLRETGQGLTRLGNAFPGVAESVGRGAIASVPGAIGDISNFARSYAPETMNDVFGTRAFNTTREILNNIPRITPTHEGAETLEDVGAAISPGIGGVLKDTALLTKDMPAGLSIMGPKSKLWNKEMAFNAGKMEAKGATPEEIHQATGMARGLDNQWRQEISDQFATMKNGENFGEIYRKGGLNGIWQKDNVLVKDVLEHPQLMEAYPHIGDIQVKTHSADNPIRGTYNQKKNEISIREDLNPEEAKSTMLHELTHSIQAKEELNRGANAGQLVNYYAKQKQDLMNKIVDLHGQMSEAYKADDMDKYRQLTTQRDVLGRKYSDMNPEKLGYQDYLHHGGEAEARLVQRRANLSSEELRNNYPYQFTGKTGHGLDINPDEAIITTHHPNTINQPSQEFDYRGTHTAPYKTNDGSTAPGHELDKIYPKDVYGPNGHRYYDMGDKMDKDTLTILKSAKGNPEQPIKVYRAVPKEHAGEDIHPGDWVTPNLDYAEQHGKYFENGHHILEKTVPAKHIYTEGNSLHEFGYDPTD